MSATADHQRVSWTELGADANLADTTALADPTLGSDLVAHLDAQLVSAQRLLAIVLEQASAIRRRAVRQVVVAAGELQVEMHRRELLERDRVALMVRASERLALTPEAIGFSSVVALMDPATAQLARERTEELTALLTKIDHEHTLNRMLMAQELSFLDHLLGLAGGAGGYAAGPGGAGSGSEAPRVRRNPHPARKRVFDLEA